MKFWGGALIFFGGLGVLGSVSGLGYELMAVKYDDDNDSTTPPVLMTSEVRIRRIIGHVPIGAASAIMLMWGLNLYNLKK